MWILVLKGILPDQGEQAWKERVQEVIVKASKEVLSVARPRQPGGTREPERKQPLIESVDAHHDRQSENWKKAAELVKKATGVDKVGDAKLLTQAYGRTLNKLLQDDPGAREEAFGCRGGLLQSACAMLVDDVEKHCIDVLHAIKNSFLCSWAHLLSAAGFMAPLLALFGSYLPASIAVKRVKDLVNERKEKASLVCTVSGGAIGKGGGKKAVPGVGFDPKSRFEALMACVPIRATMRMPKGKILICVSFDERTLAKVWLPSRALPRGSSVQHSLSAVIIGFYTWCEA